MEISAAFSFLVHPAKNEDVQPDINSGVLPLAGGVYEVLKKAFTRADAECNIDIMFESDDAQSNPVRSELLDLLDDCCLDRATPLAERLQRVTTHRSGLGLLFIVIGEEGSRRRIYITRFPADIGIVAKERGDALELELIPDVFLRNALSYKAVVLDGESRTDYWTGKAIDRQVNQGAMAISRYWIRDFLSADFRATSIMGTRRLARAIRDAMDSTDDLDVKEDLVASLRLSRTLNGQAVSIESFAERYGLSEKARDSLFGVLQNPACVAEQFEFCAEEFSSTLRYRSVHVSNGVLLTAPADSFNEKIKRTQVDEGGGVYAFTTTGSIVNEKLKKSI